MTKVVLELLFSIINFSSVVILNFVIFKVPIRKNDKQIVILSLVTGVTNYYAKFVLDTALYIPIFLLTYIVALMILRRYPILYSFVVVTTGFIASAVIDTVVTVGAIQMKLATLEQMQSETTTFIIFHAIVAAIYILIAYILHSARIGFSFVNRRFSGKGSLNTANLIWAGILISGIVVFQLALKGFKTLSLQGCLTIGHCVILIAAICYAYFQNRKVMIERYADIERGDSI